jgi:nucleoside 2-deoxyribosyltransferase
MSSKSIYLAGAIAGCDKGEANDWRDDVRAKLAQHGIIGISPLRCEPMVGKRYELNYEDPKFGTKQAIAAKNELDVRTCDLTLVYLPKALNDRRPSYGTIIELAWARILNKPVILVTDDPYLINHPLTSYCARWILPTLDDAMEVIVGVYRDYVKVPDTQVEAL